MSDHVIVLVPTDPQLVPNESGQQKAGELLTALVPRPEVVSADVDEVVAFRDCGENFERVSCPRCGAEIPTPLWQRWMSEDFSDEHGFRLEPVVMPCCGGKASLNELSYEWPQGFSRYALSVLGSSEEAVTAALPRLEATLGCKLLLIRQTI